MRIFAGGDRPFIESVTDAAPLLYLVHNAIMDSEIEAAKAKLAPYLLPHPPGRSNEAPIHRATRSLGALRVPSSRRSMIASRRSSATPSTTSRSPSWSVGGRASPTRCARTGRCCR